MSGISNIGFKKNEYSRFTIRNKKQMLKLDRNVAEQHTGLLRGLYLTHSHAHLFKNNQNKSN